MGGKDLLKLKKELIEASPREFFKFSETTPDEDIAEALEKILLREAQNDLSKMESDLNSLEEPMKSLAELILEPEEKDQESKKREMLMKLKEMNEKRKALKAQTEKLNIYLIKAQDFLDIVANKIKNKPEEDVYELTDVVGENLSGIEPLPQGERDIFITDFTKLIDEQATKYWREPINEFKMRLIEEQRAWILEKVRQRRLDLEEAKSLYNKAISQAQDRNPRVTQLITHLERHQMLL